MHHKERKITHTEQFKVSTNHLVPQNRAAHNALLSNPKLVVILAFEAKQKNSTLTSTSSLLRLKIP